MEVLEEVLLELVDVLALKESSLVLFLEEAMEELWEVVLGVVELA